MCPMLSDADIYCMLAVRYSQIIGSQNAVVECQISHPENFQIFTFKVHREIFLSRIVWDKFIRAQVGAHLRFL